VIQGAFPGGRPRIPVRAPRPGQQGTFQLKPAAAIGNATPLPDDFAGGRAFARARALPHAVQARMESLFGTSFRDVQIHEGPEASSIGALAFTQGSSIFFAPGQYNPNTTQGQRLLGQQLAHVVQQRSGRVRNPFGSGMAVVHDPLLKAEADMMGSRAAMLQPVQTKMNGPHNGSTNGRQAPAPILPKRAAANSGTAGGAATPGAIRPTVPGPILPKRVEATIPGPILPGRPDAATSRASASLASGAILPSRPKVAFQAAAPILPGRPQSSQPTAQPKMALGAAVARGQQLVNSAFGSLGRWMFGL